MEERQQPEPDTTVMFSHQTCNKTGPQPVRD